MKKIYLFACLSLFCYSHISAQTQTVGLFTHLPGSYDSGYVLFPPYLGCDTTYLINKCGKLIHKWPSKYTPGADAYLLQDGSLLRAGHYPNVIFDSCDCGTGGIIERIDWAGNVIWHYIISDSLQVQSHDICPLSNGNILVEVWENITASNAIAYGRNPAFLGSRIYSPKIIELKPIGTDSAQIVWTWRLWDHLIQDFNSSRLNYGVVKNHPELVNLNFINPMAGPYHSPDWTHLNAVSYNATLDQVMLCSRSFEEIWIIDHSTDSASAAGHTGGKYGKGGDLLYRWGNPRAFNRGTMTDKKLFMPHDPEWISYGKYKDQIMIFNNGVERSATSIDIINPPLDFSGNYLLAPDTTYGPGILSWTYPSTLTTSFYNFIMGSSQTLPNGNVLIDNAGSGEFFEIDSNANTVWKYVSPISNGIAVAQYDPISYNSVYRCMFYPKDYSAFKGRILDPGNPLELNPLPAYCDSTSDTTIGTGIAYTAEQREGPFIYPNPTKNNFSIVNANNYLFIIIDISTGREIRKGKIYLSIQKEDLSELNPGAYLLKLISADGWVKPINLMKE